ncbi:MAG: tRNA 4-thiouridine(8) synthase ThiI [Candidatus Portnoybacteria bacterium]|nr:tRNA 4-thiouridine(8) synthase ThiI [Candidatus Portnoybacteria bacterium]
MNKDTGKTKALVLLSGGLDSTLAVKLLLEQDIEVEGICFYSNFFGCEAARKAAAQLKINLREIDISEEFLEFLRRKPKYGYGVGLNPCIDCHALMLKKAGEIMKNEGFSFVATGEVLGERPMSQHKKALKIIEKEAGLEGYLLRPLSAKLLQSTMPEVKGLVIRDKLMDISGRSRKRQMDLAKKFGISNYPTPAGGCALTQGGFVERMKDLIKHKPEFDLNDAKLVKVGRHFWVNDVQIILGRSEEENKKLSQGRQKKDVVIEPENFIGPSALIRNVADDEVIKKAKELIIKSSPKAKKVKVFQFKLKRI